MEEKKVLAPLDEEALKRQIAAMKAESEMRRRLGRDSEDEEIKQGILDYIADLDEDVRTPEEQYEERLSACMQCINLVDGHCSLCGCMVDIRAAKQTKHCPAVNPRW